MRTALSNALGDRRGASAIEFAIVFPFFLALTAGMIAYGIYFGAAHSAAQLAADAARVSIAGLDDQERNALAQQHVARSTAVYPFLRPEFVTATAATSADAEFRVTVRYDARALPIWRFASFLPLPSRIIERSAAIRRGGY